MGTACTLYLGMMFLLYLCACAPSRFLSYSFLLSPVAVEAPLWRSRRKTTPEPCPPTPLLLARVHVQKGWREYTYTDGVGRPPRPRRAPTQHGTIPRPAAALSAGERCGATGPGRAEGAWARLALSPLRSRPHALLADNPPPRMVAAHAMPPRRRRRRRRPPSLPCRLLALSLSRLHRAARPSRR